MSGFLYYLPGAGSANAALLAGVGLESLFSVSDLTQVPVTHGPEDNGSGVVLAMADTDQPGFYPDRQEWQKCAGGKYWLGWARDSLPGPEDLQRGEVRDSYRFTLSDGAEWLCPVARALPSYWGFDDDDNRVRKLRPEFRELSERADAAWHNWNAEEGHFDPEWIAGLEAAELCVSALALNYRVGAREMAALGMPSAEDAIIILAGLLDIPNGGTDESKKNE